MVTTANFILKNKIDSNDAASNVILQILKYALTHDKPCIEDVDAYIFSSARNAAIKIYNQRKECSYYDALEEVAATNDGIIQVENKILVEQVLNKLPEQDRDIAQMFYFYDIKISNIAKVLQIPEGTVKWKLSEIRHKLSSYFKNH